eukprot:TRINITY_DN2342_c1_g1_i3.p1 TRINITY_DN2342_c1_g1~~TRINITY_DN2342_c1_g1_i3.p1  ORF type:complete len:777 (+),score=188.81 TRINITY_DN2342_c1_g1_i3:95-2425(+)
MGGDAQHAAAAAAQAQTGSPAPADRRRAGPGRKKKQGKVNAVDPAAPLLGELTALGWSADTPESPEEWLRGLRQMSTPMEAVRSTLPRLWGGRLSAAALRAGAAVRPGAEFRTLDELAVLGLWTLRKSWAFVSASRARYPNAEALLLTADSLVETAACGWCFRWQRSAHSCPQVSVSAQEHALMNASGWGARAGAVQPLPVRVFAEVAGGAIRYIGQFEVLRSLAEVRVGGGDRERCRFTFLAHPGAHPLPAGVPASAHRVRVFTDAGAREPIALLDERAHPFTTLGELCHRVQQLPAVRNWENCRVFLHFRPPDDSLFHATEGRPPEVRVRLAQSIDKEALQYLQCPEARLVVRPAPSAQELMADCSEGTEEVPLTVDAGSAERALAALESCGYTSQVFSPRTRILPVMDKPRQWRFVQPRGIALPLQLFHVNRVVGCGLRFTQKHPRGSYVGPFAGLLARRRADAEGDEDKCYSVDEPVPGTELQQAKVGNLLRFANYYSRHTEAAEQAGKRRCNARLDAVRQGRDGLPLGDGQKAGLGLWLTQDVEAGDELCWDYQPGYWASKDITPLGDLAVWAACAAACVTVAEAATVSECPAAAAPAAAAAALAAAAAAAAGVGAEVAPPAVGGPSGGAHPLAALAAAAVRAGGGEGAAPAAGGGPAEAAGGPQPCFGDAQEHLDGRLLRLLREAHAELRVARAERDEARAQRDTALAAVAERDALLRRVGRGCGGQGRGGGPVPPPSATAAAAPPLAAAADSGRQHAGLPAAKRFRGAR